MNWARHFDSESFCAGLAKLGRELEQLSGMGELRGRLTGSSAVQALSRDFTMASALHSVIWYNF